MDKVQARLEILDTTEEQRDWLEHAFVTATQAFSYGPHMKFETALEEVKALFGGRLPVATGFMGFTYKEDGSTVLLYGDQHVNVEALALLAQAYLKKWGKARKRLVFAFATTGRDPKTADYGGGVVVVTRSAIRVTTTNAIVEYVRYRGAAGGIFDDL